MNLWNSYIASALSIDLLSPEILFFIVLLIVISTYFLIARYGRNGGWEEYNTEMVALNKYLGLKNETDQKKKQFGTKKVKIVAKEPSHSTSRRSKDAEVVSDSGRPNVEEADLFLVSAFAGHSLKKLSKGTNVGLTHTTPASRASPLVPPKQDVVKPAKVPPRNEPSTVVQNKVATVIAAPATTSTARPENTVMVTASIAEPCPVQALAKHSVVQKNVKVMTPEEITELGPVPVLNWNAVSSSESSLKGGKTSLSQAPSPPQQGTTTIGDQRSSTAKKRNSAGVAPVGTRPLPATPAEVSHSVTSAPIVEEAILPVGLPLTSAAPEVAAGNPARPGQAVAANKGLLTTVTGPNGQGFSGSAEEKKLLSTIESLERRLKDSDAGFFQVYGDYKKLTDALCGLTPADISKLRSEAAQASTRKSSHIAHDQKLLAEIAHLREQSSEFQSLLHKFEEQQQTLANLQAENANMKESLSMDADEILSLKKKHISMEDASAALVQDISIKNDQLLANEQKIQDLNSTVEQLSSHLAELCHNSSSNAASSEALEELHLSLKQREAELQTLNSSLTASEAKVAALERELQNSRDQLHSFEEVFKQQQLLTRQFETDTLHARTEHDKVVCDLHSVIERQKLSDQLLQAKIDSMEQSEAGMKVENSRLESRLQDLEKIGLEAEALRTQLASSVVTVEQLTAENSSLTERLEVATRASLVSQNITLSLDEVRNEKIKLTDIVTVLENELVSGREQHYREMLEVNQRLEAAESSLLAVQEADNSLKQKLELAGESHRAVSDQLHSALAENQTLKQQVLEMKAVELNYERIKTALTDSQVAMDAVRAAAAEEKAATAEAIFNLQQTVSQQEKEILYHSHQAKDLRNQLVHLEESVLHSEELEAKVESLQKEASDLRDRNCSISEKYESCCSQISHVRGLMSSLGRALDIDSTEPLSRVVEAVEALALERDSLEAEVAALKKLQISMNGKISGESACNGASASTLDASGVCDKSSEFGNSPTRTSLKDMSFKLQSTLTSTEKQLQEVESAVAAELAKQDLLLKQKESMIQELQSQIHETS